MNHPQAETVPSETRQAWTTPVVCDLDIGRTAGGGGGQTDQTESRNPS